MSCWPEQGNTVLAAEGPRSAVVLKWARRCPEPESQFHQTGSGRKIASPTAGLPQMGAGRLQVEACLDHRPTM